jgi:hypothetical protein
MSQKTSEEPKGGIPQSVADDVAALAAEVRAIERKATAAWKTAVVVWIILLAVIFSYLYFWLYRGVLVPNAKPDILVELAMAPVEEAVQRHLGARLDSPDFGKVVGEKLKAAAPGLIKSQVKPQIENLLAQLPTYRAKYTAEIKQRAPKLINDGLDLIQNDLLPWANEQLMATISEHADALIAQINDQIKSAVSEVIATSRGDIKTLQQDPAALRLALEHAFEGAMGDVMDELFTDLDTKVANIRDQMQGLVNRYKAGTLTYRDKLELRLIQDVEALFSKASIEEGVGGVPGIEQILEDLKGLGVPEETRKAIRTDVRAGKAPDLSGIPDAYREKMKKEMEEEQKAKEAAKAAAGAK